DIDVDFCFERRGEVIDYVREKYGRDSVGQIITFGTLKSRAAVKDVGRTLGFTPAETDALAKLIPNMPNFSLTVKEAITKVPEVGRLYREEPRYKELLDFAISLEGLSRHAGVHAAGVVIAPGPLADYVPVLTQNSKGAGAGSDEMSIVTQYTMESLEHAGMLKMDFLGLTTLTIIDDALKSIKSRTGSAPDLDTLPLEDEETFRMLRAGRTAGVFQFESPLATDMVRSIRADSFNDLVACNALVRPGPLDAGMHKVYIRRKKGEEPVTYALPELEEFLGDTYGVMIYQEQVMRIAQKLAGLSLAEADVMRKAVGKKDVALITAELGKFTVKAVGLGYDPKIIDVISDQIATFGRYGFNKSHCVAYSIIAFHTAWLKVHHTADFMAALLSAMIGTTDSVVKYINEARELGIEILPPDVNESGYKFTVIADKRIRFGLGGIRNVGRSAIDAILSARGDKPFTSLFDVAERVDLRVCNKRVFEALIESGAMDGLGGHRAQLMTVLDTALRESSLQQEEAASGQVSMFGGAADGGAHKRVQQTLPNIAPWTESVRLAREKEILGFYTSGHPLEPFTTECELFATQKVAGLGTWTTEGMALGVVITAIKRQTSKRNGAEYARLTIEDFSGSTEVMVFPEKWSAIADGVKCDIPVLLKGGYSRRDQDAENPQFVVESVTRLVELRANGQVMISITLSRDSALDPSMVRDLRAIVDAYPGTMPLELQYTNGNGLRATLRSRSLTLAVNNNALGELRSLLGENAVRVQRGAG
ncbi:MAG: DNA polymerase III subunit alpha, partial [Gemmatimonadaceae bacterium]